MPHMGREHTPMIFIRDERLGLTDAQQKKFDLVCREFVGKIHEVISNPAIPREQKGEKIKPLQASFKDKLKQILTPAQRADIEKREKQAMADGRMEFRDHPFGAMRVMMRRMPPPPGSRDFRRPPPPPPDDPRFE
jgi:hypothetical protein